MSTPMSRVQCVRLTSDSHLEPVILDYGGVKLTHKIFDGDALGKLPAKLFCPELGDIPCAEIEGFQMVFVLNPDLAEHLIVLSLSLRPEARSKLNFRPNPAALELLSETQRLRKKVKFVSGPVVVLKNTRFSVMKTATPMDLTAEDVKKWTQHIPNLPNLSVRVAPVGGTPMRRPTQSQPTTPAALTAKDFSSLAPSSKPFVPPGSTWAERVRGSLAPQAQPAAAAPPAHEPSAVPPSTQQVRAPPGLMRTETSEMHKLWAETIAPSLEKAETSTLASDGEDASEVMGVPDTDSFSEVSPSPRPCRSPTDWSEDEVAEWLAGLARGSDWSRYIASFRANAIDGFSLRSLTREELKDDLGIQELGPRKVILSAIQTLFAAS
mmetsp:Transcript_36948/g.68874  ORF Transcript_36948/g.68874 Transcript_36948/m.68874 type:complete len:380 (+) Transcript_36948:48-1187(+)